jgi:ureidoglycolate hydrolase
MSGLTDGNACSKFDTYTSCLSTGHHENMQSSAEATIKEMKESHPLFAQCFSDVKDAESGSSTHPDANSGSSTHPDAIVDTMSSSGIPSSSISHPDSNSGSSTHPDATNGISTHPDASHPDGRSGSSTDSDATSGSSTHPDANGGSIAHPDAISGSSCTTALMFGLTDGNACSKFERYRSCLLTSHPQSMQSSAETTIKEMKESHPLFSQCFSATSNVNSDSSTHPDANGDSITHVVANSGSSTHPDALRGSSSKVNALSSNRPDSNSGSSTNPNAIEESLSGSVFSSLSSFLVAAFIIVGTAI